MSYLDELYALRQAVLDSFKSGPLATGYASYSLDGESWSAADLFDRLETLNKLILLEQNRVPGRRELRVVRGRRWWGGWGVHRGY